MTISIHNERWGMTRLPLVAAVLIITATLYIVFVSTVVFLSSLSENAAKTTRWTPAGALGANRRDNIVVTVSEVRVTYLSFRVRCCISLLSHFPSLTTRRRSSWE